MQNRELIKGSQGFERDFIIHTFDKYTKILNAINPDFATKLRGHIEYHLKYWYQFGINSPIEKQSFLQEFQNKITAFLRKPEHKNIFQHCKNLLQKNINQTSDFHQDSAQYQSTRLTTSLLNFALNHKNANTDQILRKNDNPTIEGLKKQRNQLLQNQSLNTFLEKSELSQMEKTILLIVKQIETELKSKFIEIEKERTEINQILTTIHKIHPKLQIDADFYTRIQYATDASDIHAELPMAVFYPRSQTEIIQIIELAHIHNFKILPHGGGTGLTGGCVPLQKKTMIMSTQEMCKINSVEFDQNNQAKIWTQAGANTKQVIDQAQKAGYIHAVDPASNKGCTVGGNLANGAGGPSTFELGSAIDNILEFKQIMPDGTLIHAKRVHPEPTFRGRIAEDDYLEFEINILIKGEKIAFSTRKKANTIRRKGLAKDVMDKVLGEIPGIQKEGTDGIITDICWALHQKPKHQTTILLTTKNLSAGDEIIQKLIQYRQTQNNFQILKLEQWDKTYAYSIALDKIKKDGGNPLNKNQKTDLKSLLAESTFVIDIGSKTPQILTEVENFIEIISTSDCLIAEKTRNSQEREDLWEDRHKLKAISAKTNGFKINEDFVIPIQYFKEFDQAFLELRAKYQTEWQKLQTEDFHKKEKELTIAYHAHYGDGNLHVNIPLYSQFPEMVKLAHDFLAELYTIVHEKLGGSATGEHGIGLAKKDLILKVNPDYKKVLDNLKRYRAKFDYKKIWHPNALDPDFKANQSTPSHQKIADQLGLHLERVVTYLEENPTAEKLLKYSPEILKLMIETFEDVRKCMRCGACRPTCSYYRPDLETGNIKMSPREKNLRLRAWFALFTEHLVYDNEDLIPPNQWLSLEKILNSCSECGKCADNCSAGIDTSQVIQNIKKIIEKISQRNGNIRLNPFTAEIIDRIIGKNNNTKNYSKRLKKFFQGIPLAETSRKLFNFPPQNTPLVSLGKSLYQKHQKNFFQGEKTKKEEKETKLYFPGCGENQLEKETAQAVVFLLTEIGHNVIIPEEQLCCGHPAEFKGKDISAITTINTQKLNTLAEKYQADTLLLNCGSCRKTFEKYMLNLNLPLDDAMTTVFAGFSNTQKEILKKNLANRNIGYKIPCHTVADETLIKKLRELEVNIEEETQCCGMRGDNNFQNPQEFADRTRDTAQRWQTKKTDTMVSTCSSCTRANVEVASKMQSPFKTQTLPVFIAENLDKNWRKKVS